MGCISAWAEEPGRYTYVNVYTAVHLRVGGGTFVPMNRGFTTTGASPRGRRNP